ncbi:MAG TPA: 30S ribosomal protein S6e [Nanoarchaeota archaeon]|nr:30S ribosomal protein S6e [Nanoarchaeota archaeon]
MNMAKFVISDPKTRRAWQIERDAEFLYGKKIGDKFDGSLIGLPGYVLEITGGTDKDGFPMRPDLEGTVRKKLLLASGPGYRPKRKGVRKRKTVRGNTIAEDIAQINCKVVAYGDKPLEELLGKKEEEKKEE